MTIPNIKVKVVRRPTLKLKVLPKFPSSVSAASPLTLNRTGGNFAFGLSVTDLRVTFDGIYAPIGVALGAPFVILCAGQSQNVRSKTFSWSPSSSAKVWNNTIGTVSTGTTFVALDGTHANFPQVLASDIAIATGRPVYVINSSFAGEPISHWLSGTGAPDMYADAVANVAAALSALSLTKIDLFVWWQGEGDTGPLNAGYIANHATMMSRFWGNSWFPQETPVIVNSIASTAINTPNTDADNMNSLLLGVVNADPDKRRYVYTASLSSATYWDATDVGHMTAQGYYSVGAMVASAFLNGPGRNSLKNVLINPSTGNAVLGNPGLAVAPIAYNGNSAGITLPTGGGTLQLAGADSANVFSVYDAFGAFTNVVGRRANGTLAAKTALITDDLIAGLGAQGYDGSAYSSGNAASFNYFAQANWTGSNHSTYAAIGLVPNGSTTNSTYHRWDAGSYTINGSTSGFWKIQPPAAAGSVTLTTGQYPGTATNDNATAGNFGEYIESVIASGSATALTSTAAKNITSISLTAGDWDVDAIANFSGGATTTITYLSASISTTTATTDATAGRYNVLFGFSGALFDTRSPTAIASLPLAPLRFSLSATTTIFLVANSSFATSTCSAFGILRARRVR